MMMRDVPSATAWTAAVVAATATATIVALLSRADPQSSVLFAAEAVATMAVISLLLGGIVAYVLMRRHEGTRRPLWELLAGSGADFLGKRRGVLEDRLELDEPRLCSQYMLGCTCWSLCGKDEDQPKGVAAVSAQGRKVIPLRALPPKGQTLPVVHRSGMDACPFRFASPLARRGSTGGVACNDSDSGSATR